MLDFLRRPIAARWIGFGVYRDTGITLNRWLIYKGQWIIVREDLLLLKSNGFRYS